MTIAIIASCYKMNSIIADNMQLCISIFFNGPKYKQAKNRFDSAIKSELCWIRISLCSIKT